VCVVKGRWAALAEIKHSGPVLTQCLYLVLTFISGELITRGQY